MKIIITEEQLTMVDWFLENQEKLDIIFYNIISSEYFYGNYVMFRPLDNTINSVINRLYEEWSYVKMNFSGESSIKEYLRNHYSKEIKNQYRKTKRDYPHHNF